MNDGFLVRGLPGRNEYIVSSVVAEMGTT